jgi:arylsulfatase A-like enzyme
VLFANAVSTTSWTLPAHAALFTGLYDISHGVTRDRVRLTKAHVTLAEALRDAGYRTAGFYGGPYLNPVFGLAQGFETYRSCASDLPQAGSSADETDPHPASHADITGPKTVQEVRRWIEAASDVPFFLFVHLWDVHYDYIPPAPYAEIFDPDYRGDLDGAGFDDNPNIHADMPPRDLEHLIALYDGEIRFTDGVLARILELLERKGRLANTLVVMTADHGEEFFEHGDKGHEKTLFEEVVRVPLVFRWPGRIDEGTRVQEQVRLIDVMPTVLSLAGVPLPAEVQGRDLSRALRGEPLPAASALLELHMLGRQLIALRTNEWMILADEERAQLFDLREDPGQKRAHLPSHPKFASALRELREVRARAQAFRSMRSPEERPVTLDPDTRRRLEELGYIDP